MPSDSDHRGLVLNAITICLCDEARYEHTETRQALALQALAAVLVAFDDLSPAWTVHPLPDAELLCYTLTPLPGNPISADLAWRVAEALRQQPQIAAARPDWKHA